MFKKSLAHKSYKIDENDNTIITAMEEISEGYALIEPSI